MTESSKEEVRAAEAAPAGSIRSQVIARAIKDWKDQLIDLGGRNNLLYYRDLKIGTLDLSGIAPEVYELLLEGEAVALSSMFLDPQSRRDAARRARKLHDKAKENDEERGIRTLYLAVGFATWDEEQREPNAPVLLIPVEARPLGATSDDFELTASIDDREINPTLLYALSTRFAVELDGEAIVQPGSTIPYQAVVSSLCAACSAIPGFTVRDRTLVGNFSYAKLPMVQDLERAQSEIENHDLLAAIAGDQSAIQAMRQRYAGLGPEAVVALPPPTDEFIVLDADSSQSHVVAAGVAGHDLVVIGPPGTGKSQTIANLIATLVARNRSVLFVAEKRAAIEAVLKRLEQRGLQDVILDLHDGAGNKRRIAQQLGHSLGAAHEVLAPDVKGLHQRLEQWRTRLEGYAGELHTPLAPWGLSPFEVESRLLAMPLEARLDPSIRIRGDALLSLSDEAVVDAQATMVRFVELGGPRLIAGDSPWSATYHAGAGSDPDSAAAIEAALYEFRARLRESRGHIEALCRRTGVPMPITLGDTGSLVELLSHVDETIATLGPGVLDEDLATLARRMAPAGRSGLLRLAARLLNGKFRSARRRLRQTAPSGPPPDPVLFRGVQRLAGAVEQWKALGGVALTSTIVAGFGEIASAHSAAQRSRAVFAGLSNVQIDDTIAHTDADAFLGELEADHQMLSRIPSLLASERELRRRHFGDVLQSVVRDRLRASIAGDAVVATWLASIAERAVFERRHLSEFEVEGHAATAEEFARTDVRHIETSAARVRRAWAEHTVHARNAFPDEEAIVKRQASLSRRHLPLRNLFDQAEHVLTAIKPCWVMSPLVVAQVLPGRRCFDVVIFDEASQVAPADATSAILRGAQTIVAGDPKQLPPTHYFAAGVDDESDEDEEDAADEQPETALTKDIASILEVMQAVLPLNSSLRWHYRSHDERLITFSNAQESLYDWGLTTFPGARTTDCLRFIQVPFRPGATRVTASNPDEVVQVLALVEEHAAERPEESLGIIALGSDHADAIQEALRRASAGNPVLARLMDADREEPLFIKNLERVQGDERDAIILTTGYSKTTDGRMRYQFGPLTHGGGERRLNVAITRARSRMTVVSSFSGGEMEPDRLHSVGSVMLRDYLLYVESGGTNLGIRAKQKPDLNPFERDVFDRLSARGLRIVPQYGASGYWIDFVAMHPDRPSEPVLAIEADGARYHASPSARDRDRLRQEHLERLGWRFHRIWSTEWFRNRDAEVDRAVRAFEQALRAQPAQAPHHLPAANATTRAARAPMAAVRSVRPSISPGRGSINEYTQSELRDVVRWIKSDGRNYTDNELIMETMSLLRFTRRGARIVDAIQRAIDAERS